MKKIVVLIMVAVFVASCGPKRARCYGKRCVDNSKIESNSSPKRTT